MSVFAIYAYIYMYALSRRSGFTLFICSVGFFIVCYPGKALEGVLLTGSHNLIMLI